MYKINEIIEIEIIREDANFDRACDAAYKRACIKFGLDDYGHLHRVKDYDRSKDVIIINFISYKHIASMIGHNYIYRFNTCVERRK